MHEKYRKGKWVCGPKTGLVSSPMFLRACAVSLCTMKSLRKQQDFRAAAGGGKQQDSEGSSLCLLPKCLPLNSQLRQETLRMTLTFASHKMLFTLILEPWSIEGAEWQGRIFLLRGKQCSSKRSHSLKNLPLKCVWRLQTSYFLLRVSLK